jgi:hypothetical protein
LQTILENISRKGESSIFERRADGQSNMTTLLYGPGQSHMTNSITSAVPYEYSEPYPCHGSTLQVLRPAPFFISSENIL